MSEVVACFVVDFGEGADTSALVAMEFDDTMNVDDEGKVKSKFRPGDDIFFLIHHELKLRIESVKTTGGMVVSQGSVTRVRSNELLWNDLEEKQLSYVPSGGITAEWYWREGSGLKKTDTRNAMISGGELPVEGLIKYDITAKLYRLATPKIELEPNETKKITNVAELEAATA